MALALSVSSYKNTICQIPRSGKKAALVQIKGRSDKKGNHTDPFQIITICDQTYKQALRGLFASGTS
jgi:hypothetical protein